MSAIARARAALVVAAALVACAPQAVRRDPDIRIASVMAFDAARFAGSWQVVASHTPGCAGAGMGWAETEAGFVLSGTDCTGTAPAPLAAMARLVGPGARLAAAPAFSGEPVWVLWVDQGYRIAVLGTPSGRWAMIVVRPGAARADLIAAARDVLAFNGYDLAQLAGTP